MLALMGLSGILCFIVTAILGARLLLLASRTRQIPEFAVGSSFLSAGVIGWGMMLGSNLLGGPGSANGEIVFVSGFFFITLGVTLIYLFTWRVFRPDEKWAAVLFWVSAAVLTATSVPFQLAIFDATREAVWFPWLDAAGKIARVGAGVWGGLESYRYWNLMRKRQALGLADPLLTNRFLLWGGASIATATIMMITSIAPPSAPDQMNPMMAIAISALATVVGVQQFLAFLPPKSFQVWVRSRAEASAS
jgi:hypothetical protein